MKVLVDNCSALGVEKCLVKHLPDLLKTVPVLDEATISNIAAESGESRLERSRTMEKLKVLESTLLVLRSLDRHRPAGESILAVDRVAKSDSAFSVMRQKDDSQSETSAGEHAEVKESVTAEDYPLNGGDQTLPPCAREDEHDAHPLSPEPETTIVEAAYPVEEAAHEDIDWGFSPSSTAKKSSKKVKKGGFECWE
jgi:hypothetical protein